MTPEHSKQFPRLFEMLDDVKNPDSPFVTQEEVTETDKTKFTIINGAWTLTVIFLKEILTNNNFATTIEKTQIIALADEIILQRYNHDPLVYKRRQCF